VRVFSVGSKGCVIKGNSIWGNQECGVVTDFDASPLLLSNLIHHHELNGLNCGGSCASLEGNRIWACKTGIAVISENSSPLIASNAIFGCYDGIVVDNGAKLRLVGNALWDNERGMWLCPTLGCTLTGNQLARSGCGIKFAPGFHASSTLSLGPGNAFSGCREGGMVDVVDGKKIPCRLSLSSEFGFCAHCAKEVAFGKLTCGGCTKFGGAQFAPSYCGAACQRAHWPAHRAECRRAEARARAREAAFAAAADAALEILPAGSPHGRPGGDFRGCACCCTAHSGSISISDGSHMHL